MSQPKTLNQGSHAEDIFDEPSDDDGKTVKAFVIGDPHFKAKLLEEGGEFAERTLKAARRAGPDFIVVLGDTLDTHEVVRVQPHNLACDLVEGLSRIAPVYLLIGNHDFINQSQFLTTNHIFGPLKKWKNVTVVDKPVYDTYGDYSFVFCPYVQPGRFTEALDRLVSEGETWDLADCIFAHQEFHGCKMGAITSEEGDKWDEAYPPVISGHIHNAQTVGENVFYPGSALQHAFGEDPDKRLWEVTFGGTDEPPYFTVKKIHLGMKGKKIVYLDMGDVENFNEKLLERYHIKLTLRGTSEQFKVFRRGKRYADLRKKGVKFSYDPVASDNEAIAGEARSRKQISFVEVLKEVVRTKTDPVKNAYREIVGADVDVEEEESQIIYELVFEEESEDLESDDEESEDEEEDLESDDEESEDEEEDEDESEDIGTESGDESEENQDTDDSEELSSEDEIYLDEEDSDE